MMPPKPSLASSFSSLTLTVTPLPASSLRAAVARSAGGRGLAGSLDRSRARLGGGGRDGAGRRGGVEAPPPPGPPARARRRDDGQAGQLGRGTAAVGPGPGL